VRKPERGISSVSAALGIDEAKIIVSTIVNIDKVFIVPPF